MAPGSDRAAPKAIPRLFAHVCGQAFAESLLACRASVTARF
jgi:hypothetical protein